MSKTEYVSYLRHLVEILIEFYGAHRTASKNALLVGQWNVFGNKWESAAGSVVYLDTILCHKSAAITSDATGGTFIVCVWFALGSWGR